MQLSSRAADAKTLKGASIPRQVGQYVCLRNDLLEAVNVHFFPLRGLKERGVFIAKGGARKNKVDFFEFSHISYLFAAPYQIPTVVYFTLRLSGRSLLTTQLG